ncbi:MAG: substrate-binding domain-containing protein [Mycobacteriales bacterium]
MGRHRRRAPWQLGREPLLLSLVALIAVGVSVVTVRSLSAESAPPGGGCTGPTSTLSVGTDPAAVSWLTPLARQYTDAGHSLAGRCLAVQVRPLTLDQARQALQPVPFPGAGTPPDVWIPESTTSLNLVRARPEIARVLAVPATPVATSPIVIAAPGDALLALARLKRGASPKLTDLVTLSRDLRGWGQPGIERPDWGRVRLSTLDPGTTSLGASLVVAAVGALTGTPAPDVGAKAFQAPRAREGLLGLIRSVQSAPATVSALLAPLNRASTAAEVVSEVGVLAAYEQDVWRYNSDLPAIVLRAGYPLAGQLAADHPFVVPAASWVDAADKAAAADFRSWLRSDEVQARLSSFGLRRADGTAGPELVGPTQALSAEPMPPVPPRAVDGPTAARTAWRLLTRRISLLGLFDVSGSMADPVPGTTKSRLDVARSAAQAALGFFDERDAIGLWEFSRQLDGERDYRVLVPLGPAGTPVNGFPDRRAASLAAYRAMVPRTATGLYDSILAAYESTSAAYRTGYVNTLAVISDGQNEDPGGITLPALLSALKQRYDPQKPVHIVALAYGSGADRAALAQLAQTTDGLQFASPDPRRIGQVFVTAVTTLAG